MFLPRGPEISDKFFEADPAIAGGVEMNLTFGARLRSQREQQHVELTAIAEETKINVALLEGLERDDVSRWPGGLFRRAYVRAYAQKIGLDPEQILREFLALYPDPVDGSSPVEAIVQHSQARRPRTRIGFLIAGLAGRKGRRPDTSMRRLVTPDVSQPSIPIEPDAPASVLPDMLPPVAEESHPVAEELHQSGAEAPQPVAELPDEYESQPPGRLVMVPSLDGTSDTRRDSRMERHVSSVARLCTRISRANDDQDVMAALEETVHVLDAQGVILWVWDPDRDSLYPAVAHGYPDSLLSKLPDVSPSDDNAIAAAFCCGQKQVVRGAAGATGALVVPLTTPDGCAGALALEFTDGGEQHELCQSLATIVTAQLSTLFTVTPHVGEEEHVGVEEWERVDRSLVAS